LNQDGRKDLVFLETGKKSSRSVVIFPPVLASSLPADRWAGLRRNAPFRGRRGAQSEPREAMIVRRDGRQEDMNLRGCSFTDRVQVYPQE
jgi:hypothetical protein